MIRAKTCLVLGAGASVPYNFPTGVGLKDLILAMKSPGGPSRALQFPLRGRDNQFQAPWTDYKTASPELKAQQAAAHWSAYLDRICNLVEIPGQHVEDFRRTFFRAKSSSIDRFIQFNEEEFGRVGRLHIAAVLLACELDYHLYEDWYALLLETIAPNGPQDVTDGMLSVITFNYDRSFERFFTEAFEAGFKQTPKEAANLLSKIRIHHVYGQLASLEVVPYGDTGSAHAVAKLIDLVRPCADEERRAALHKLIADAENVCFIGFSFAAENIGLFDLGLLNRKKVFATTLGLPQNRIAEIKRKMPKITLFDGTALELFHNHDIFAPVAKPDSKLPAPRKQRPVTRTPGGFLNRSLDRSLDWH